MAAKKLMYAVLRLNDSIEIEDVFKKKHYVNMVNKDCAGMIPVFKTLKRAKQSSENGKYEILAIAAK